jgi:hypothetical protein
VDPEGKQNHKGTVLGSASDFSLDSVLYSRTIFQSHEEVFGILAPSVERAAQTEEYRIQVHSRLPVWVVRTLGVDIPKPQMVLAVALTMLQCLCSGNDRGKA